MSKETKTMLAIKINEAVSSPLPDNLCQQIAEQWLTYRDTTSQSDINSMIDAYLGCLPVAHVGSEWIVSDGDGDTWTACTDKDVTLTQRPGADLSEIQTLDELASALNLAIWSMSQDAGWDESTPEAATAIYEVLTSQAATHG